MKLHQIRYLIAVADGGSIRAGARALGVSQASVTQALRELEQAQQLPLFTRQSAGLSWTEAGRTLLRHARLLAEQLAQAEADMGRLRGHGAPQRLSVGVTPWIAQSLLPGIVKAFGAEMPEVRLELFDGLSAVALPRLREGTLDLVLGRLPEPGAAHDLQCTPLFRYEATVGARAGHPLAGARHMSELAEAHWLLNYAPAEEAAVLQQLFTRQGLAVPHPRIHLAQSAALMLKLVASTDMLTLLPWPLIECAGAHGHLVALPLDNCFAAREVGLLRRRHEPLSRPAQRFLQHLVQQVRLAQVSTEPMLQRVFRSIDLLDAGLASLA